MLLKKALWQTEKYHNDKPTLGNQIDIMEKYFDIRIEEGLSDLQKIQFKILNQYYYEILNGYANQEHINPLIGRLKKRFDMLGKIFKIKEVSSKSKFDIEVIDLKSVNLEIKK